MQRGESMGCKTIKGMGRKMLTGDGRKDCELDKTLKKAKKKSGW